MFTKDCFKTIDAFKAQTRRKHCKFGILTAPKVSVDETILELLERHNQAVADVKEMQQILSRAIIAPEDQQRADELMK